MDVSFSDIEGLWEAGKRMRKRGDRSIRAKFTLSFILAVMWAIWLTRNQALFQGSTPYVENTWNSVIPGANNSMSHPIRRVKDERLLETFY
ncbi:hypothetical protein QJS04_geneDACA015935 [Acorus gramineus]|uniref:Uncharacterized protein n=1 Tax=Acorus gramineus TaxID=55184 RepID=A0AAV9BFA7_ACOGR|nr:hypothetical protein QJS04_geneDACA015935 [Acorus gramineus]